MQPMATAFHTTLGVGCLFDSPSGISLARHHWPGMPTCVYWSVLVLDASVASPSGSGSECVSSILPRCSFVSLLCFILNLNQCILHVCLGVPPPGSTRTCARAYNSTIHPWSAMPSQHGNLRLLWETTSKPMLPCFQRVLTAAWIRDQALWRDQHAELLKGGLVQWPACKDLAVWIVEQLDGVTTNASPGLRHCTLDGGCCLLSRHKCKATGGGMWLVGAYAKLVVGYDERGMPVHEYAHRLVAWACGGWSSATNVAMHRGCGSRACRSKLCVNPYHLQWGTPTNNAQDRQRHKAKGRHLHPASTTM